jgi:C4-dicarboxylate transporter DctM subunit
MALIRWMDLGPVGFLLLVNAILIVIGALMDSISCTLIFAPMLAPVAFELYGIDPVHFGVVFVINMEIGYLMPPVATNLFVAAAVFRKSFGQVTRAVVPTLAITCLALIVVMYVPTLSKAAVNLKRGKPAYQAFPFGGKPAPAKGRVEVEAGVTAPPAEEGGNAMSKVRNLKIKGLDDEDEEETSGPDAGAKAIPP